MSWPWARKKTRVPRRPGRVLPGALFIITLITTIIAGARYQGGNPFTHPGEIFMGLPFAISLILILGTHELGHYIASRRHGVLTTLPLFIPGPPIPPMIGTFGAVIRIKTPITTKNALVDIGAAGPLSGFVIATVVTFIGLRSSSITPLVQGTGALGFGNSLIFKGLTYLAIGPVPRGFDVFLSPMAFAGWIGFFVTAMNLLPLGQLDGGHVVYALLGDRQRPLTIFIVILMAALGYLTWPGWFIWGALIAIIGLWHPPIEGHHEPLDRRRKFTAAAAILVFVLTCMPTPFYIV